MNFVTNPIQATIMIIAIVICASLITRLVTFLLNKMERFKKDMTSIYLIRDIINYVIYFIAIMNILFLFDVNLYGVLLSLGIVGIAASLAAKDLVSNLLSGIILIIGRSIRVGDTIEINNTKGVVKIIQLRTTTIQDDDGIISRIPNSTLTNNLFKLYKKPEKYRVNIFAGLPLNKDVDEFKSHIINEIEKLDGVLNNPKPNIYSSEITPKKTKVKISFWIKDFNNKDHYKLIIINEIRKYIKD